MTLSEKAVSKKQQRFFGMVRAAQKGEMEDPSPEITKVASTVSKSDVKKMASTKHKGLPEKKEVPEVGEVGLELTEGAQTKSTPAAGKKKGAQQLAIKLQGQQGAGTGGLNV